MKKVKHKELCGHPTPNGPCNMRKGHSASWHRNRDYPEMRWTLKSDNGEHLAQGTGVNPLTYAISRNRSNGIKLLVEIVC